MDRLIIRPRTLRRLLNNLHSLNMLHNLPLSPRLRRGNLLTRINPKTNDRDLLLPRRLLIGHCRLRARVSPDRMETHRSITLQALVDPEIRGNYALSTLPRPTVCPMGMVRQDKVSLDMRCEIRVRGRTRVPPLLPRNCAIRPIHLTRRPGLVGDRVLFVEWYQR